MRPWIPVLLAAAAIAPAADAQLVLLPSDTPLTVPGGGSGSATSWVSTDVSAATTGVQLYLGVSFADPANSGAMLYLLGPNTVPPSGFCYLGCAAGGDVYMIVDDAAPATCTSLGCCQTGCGSAGSPVYCSPLDSLTAFFGGEPSAGDDWGFQAGDGPPTAGTVIEDWVLYLELDGGVFFDGFETGDTIAWQPLTRDHMD